MEMIALEGVSSLRGTILALDGVTLGFRPGEFTALAGLNGAGKSTLLETVSGLLPGYTGSCVIDNRQARDWPPRELARSLSFLPQQVAARLPFSVQQVVLMGRFPHCGRWFESAEDRRAAERAMTLTGCAQFRSRGFHTLSGGERQRVLLAAALAQEPRALLLDEPGAFVDLPHQLQIFRMLRDLCRDGLLCIAATHDLNIAAAYCSRLVILDQGRVLIDAPPADAFQHPRFLQTFGPAITTGQTPSGRPWLWYAD
jgi:iron complex transport system ATP-binding protein